MATTTTRLGLRQPALTDLINPVADIGDAMGTIDNWKIPAAKVFHNTTQSIASGGEQAVIFNSERFDSDTMHDTATNSSRLTCKTSGLYIFHANLNFPGNATGSRALRLRHTAISGGAQNYIGWVDFVASTVAATYEITAPWLMAVGDYVELLAFQNSGGALLLSGSTGANLFGTEFSAIWQGRIS